jgi:hypothetical protein
MNSGPVTPGYIHPSDIILDTMCPKQSQAEDQTSETETTEYFRRHILAVGAGTGATMLAGCSADTTGADLDDDGSSSDDTDSGSTAAGTFRLLISDQPVAIEDFDELNVSFDRARIFSEGAEEEEEDNETEQEEDEDELENGENETEEDELEDEDELENGDNETEEDEQEDELESGDNETEEDDGRADDGDQRGFQVIDLDGATVDLTQVVGDKAIGVFEGTLEEGRYTKVELYAADVEGILEDERVEVMIPSGKLQIVKPFEVVAGETLSFVFDINVVKKGQKQEYNLLPVISGSGVAGEDVEVEEVGEETSESAESDDSESETGDSEGAETEGSEEADSEEDEPEEQAGSE